VSLHWQDGIKKVKAPNILKQACNKHIGFLKLPHLSRQILFPLVPVRRYPWCQSNVNYHRLWVMCLNEESTGIFAQKMAILQTVAIQRKQCKLFINLTLLKEASNALKGGRDAKRSK
jgi:hypothetical protein